MNSPNINSVFRDMNLAKMNGPAKAPITLQSISKSLPKVILRPGTSVKIL